MAGSIAKAYVQIIPSAEGIKGKLSNVFNGEMPSAGQNAGGIFGSNLISKIKGLIAAAGLGKLLGESLTAGGDLQQSLGGVETLFKDSAGIVIANAEQAYKTAGMSANAYMENVTSFSASLLQGLSGDTEKAAAIADMAMVDMSDNANKFGTDMESIQNAYQGFAKQNYTMLDNLKLGYGGTKTEMERLLAHAQKLTGIKYDISNLSDVYSAIHAVQKELHISGLTAEEAAEMVAAGIMTEEEAFEALGTTAKEATTTFTGSISSMKAAFTDLLGQMSLGTEDLTPYFDALSETVFTFVSGNLLPMVGNIFSALPTVLSGAFSMAIRGLNLLADNADSILQQGIDLVTGIGSAIITALPYLAEAALNVVSAMGNAIATTDWMQIGQDTINGLRSSLDLAAGEIMGTDGSIVQSVLDAVASGLPSILEGGASIVIEMANGILQALPGFLETAGDLMNQLLDTVLSMLPDMLASGVSLIGQLVTGLVSNLPSIIESAARIIAELLATIASHLPDLLAQGIALICELAAGLISAIPDVIASIPEIISSIIDTFGNWDWGEIGSNIISGIANGISAGVGAIIEAAKNAAKSALNSAKKFLGIASPSKVMRDQVGKFIPAGLAVGIETNTKPITDAMHDLSELATDTIQADLKFDQAPSAAVPAGRVYGDTNVTIQVYASEGQNVDELAEILMQKFRFEIAKKEAAIRA